MRMTTTVYAVLTMLAIPTAVSAQNADPLTLSGLRSFTIFIADLDEEDERSCGVTRTGMYTALRSTLGQSDIAITDNPRMRDGVIHLQVTVLSDCTANIDLSVQASVTLEKNGTRVFAPVWERSRLRTGLKGRSAGAAITRSVEETAELLVDDWNAVNEEPLRP